MPYYNHTSLSIESGPLFVVEKNSFQQKKKYKLKVTVTNKDGGQRILTYVIKTNMLPHSGSCTNDKTSAQAVVDPIRFTCKNWIDEEPFLSYELWVRPSNSEPKLLYFGEDATFEMKLPLGDRNNSYNLPVLVKILDGVKESTSVELNITVVIQYL